MKKYVGCVLLILAGSALSFGQGDRSGQPAPGGNQQPYQPAVPQGNTVVASGGYGGGYGGTTAAGSALNGMASVISAKGDYNLSTSAAAINMTVAEKNEIQNRQQWTDTYFQMRAANRAARAAEAGPKPTMEQLVRIAREGAPTPVTPSQVDPLSGRIDWPGALQQEAFAAERAQLDQLMATRAKLGGLGYSDQEKARDAIDAMWKTLKSLVREVPPQVYVTSRNFLSSLMYTTAKAELN
jgi:hypothetical protein